MVVPGRAGAAGEVLVQQEPEQRAPGSPHRRRAGLVALAGLVLAVGAGSVLGGGDTERPPPAPRPEPVPAEPFPGVSASSRLLYQESLRVRLLVEVRIAAEPATTGLPGSGASAAQVRLQGITAPGLVVQLADRPAPVLLGYVGRFGSGLEQVVELQAEVVVQGCAEPERPRRLTLEVTRSTRSADVSSTVGVRDRPEVSSALEGLVQRSCRGGRR